jgi:hypothetical protein
MTQQQYTDLFNRHLNPTTFTGIQQQLRNANNTLNQLNTTTPDHNADFINWGNQNLITLGKQKSQMKNMNGQILNTN